LIEKAVELGVSEVVPLATARSVAQPVEQALDRLRRTVIEASKQCGRNRLMQLSQARSWGEFIESTATIPVRLLAHPGDQRDWSARLHPSPFSSVTLAVGPEGGFSPEELSVALDVGWQRVTLGARILRVETAAIFLAASVTQCL
jgi:16S rRNA (uracil1498-N3)-methyltransferase